MTPERLNEIRALLSDPTAFEFGDLTGTADELLAEVERLRGAAGKLQRELVHSQMLGDMGMKDWHEAERSILHRGRELGLFREEA